MQDETRFTMIAPASGFTNRVMTRLAERERARARRRALIGSALLVSAVVAMIAFALVQIVSDVWVLLTKPQVIVAALNAFQTLTFWIGALLNAFWIAANVILANLDPVQTMTCALAVFALTMLWARAVTGSFQLSSNYVGGFGK
ncbi:MAG: hypothetical protein L0Y55_08285 [Anaerolineales bacterium]|nr:hypothetical protein [Anaerolineales bacterium]